MTTTIFDDTIRTVLLGVSATGLIVSLVIIVGVLIYLGVSRK